MKKYNIPPTFKKGFIYLSQLSNEQLNIIIKVLKEAPFGIPPDKIIKDIIAHNIQNEETVIEVMKAIFSLFALKTDESIKVEALVKDLSSAFKEDNPELGETEINNLAINLHEVLSIESKVNHTLKAFNLLAENDKIFLEARVLSDIRIVFNDNLSKEVHAHGTVVLHQLRINYSENRDSKSIFLALDINDLNSLKEQIERAIQKHKIIESNSFSSLPFIKTENIKNE
jgi:hypothetical protein